MTPSRPRGLDTLVRRLEEIEASGEPGTVRTPTGDLEVSKLDKVFFPKTGHTKGDIMRFYAHVSPMLLPAIADRPLVMRRYPNGVTGKSFYQHKAPDEFPDAVRVELVEDEGLTPIRRLIGGDLATLLYLVQLGAISVDPWSSRVSSVTSADYAVIDLDPGPRVSFARVVDVAHVVKEVLDATGLRAVPKTSGSTGMHIVLPLERGIPNDGARALAELVATETARRAPRIATVDRSVNARPRGTVYVDYLQNIRGKTVAGVYSVRARDIPAVSTPLEWSEVDEALDPQALTIDTVPARLRTTGDLWAAGMRRPNRLTKTPKPPKARRARA